MRTPCRKIALLASDSAADAPQARGARPAVRSTDDDFYNQGPIEEDEYGIATTSATVELGSPKVSADAHPPGSSPPLSEQYHAQAWRLPSAGRRPARLLHGRSPNKDSSSLPVMGKVWQLQNQRQSVAGLSRPTSMLLETGVWNQGIARQGCLFSSCSLHI